MLADQLTVLLFAISKVDDGGRSASSKWELWFCEEQAVNFRETAKKVCENTHRSKVLSSSHGGRRSFGPLRMHLFQLVYPKLE